MITVLHLRDGLGHGQPTFRRMKCRVKLPAHLLSARTKIIKTCFLANFDQSLIKIQFDRVIKYTKNPVNQCHLMVKKVATLDKRGLIWDKSIFML